MRIELTKNQALTLATMAIAADTSRNAVTPVLTQVAVTVENGKLTAAATDRFMAVKYVDDVIGDDGEFRLTQGLAKFLKTNLTKSYRYDVTITVENRDVTVQLFDGPSLTETWYDAKYPAIVDLIDKWEPDTQHRTLAMKLEFLARLEKIKLDGEFAELWHLEPGANTYNPNRPGPLMARAAKSDRRLVAIVQPNLLVEEN